MEINSFFIGCSIFATLGLISLVVFGVLSIIKERKINKDE